MPDALMGDLLNWLAQLFGTDLFIMRGIVTLLVICLLCGMVGALVVGNRMAFFSDAMAHCAFAGVALGVLSVAFSGVVNPTERKALEAWLVPLVMVAFGVTIGA